METIVFFCIFSLIYPVYIFLLEIFDNLVGNLMENVIEKLIKKFFEKLFLRSFLRSFSENDDILLLEWYQCTACCT